uniref:Putative secreted protein n=1 Tax=Anopheles darlingi TaxID=43151 RepID=A0A2M4D6V7_ANODA
MFLFRMRFFVRTCAKSHAIVVPQPQVTTNDKSLCGKKWKEKKSGECVQLQRIVIGRQIFVESDKKEYRVERKRQTT